LAPCLLFMPHKHPYSSCFSLSVSRGKYINLKNNKIVFALYTQVSIILIEYCILYKMKLICSIQCSN
jgi:hypothetical protein